MEKIKKRIANLKVAGKLKVYRMTVLVMTLFFDVTRRVVPIIAVGHQRYLMSKFY